MSILERLRDPGSIDLGRRARDLRRDLPIIGDNRNAVERFADAAARAAEDLARSAERVADRAGHVVERREPNPVAQLAETAADALGTVTSAASSAAGSVTAAAGDVVGRVGDRAARTGRELHLDGRIEDVVKRVRQDLPKERVGHLVTSLERGLPLTDRDRYDRAYRRGWARARTSYIGLGLLAGLIAGIAGMFLLDPERGAHRRTQLLARTRKVSNDAARVARKRATWTSDRARGIAIERGILKPSDRSNGHSVASESGSAFSSTEPVLQATPMTSEAVVSTVPPVNAVVPPLVPVMDPSLGSLAGGPDPDPGGVEPVMPLADGPVTDPTSIEREPLDGPAGGYLGGVRAPIGEEPEPAADMIPQTTEDDARLPVNTSAVTSTLEPEAENATITGEDDDRGTWHRNL